MRTMKGKKKVIEQLQMLLRGELASRDQYFTHSRMYEDWGLGNLYERTNHEMEEETEHASVLIKRILFLEHTPDLSDRQDLRIGKDVPSMLKNDLEVEYKVISALKDAIAVCEGTQDYQTRELLEKLLADTEEDHAYWLEQQLELIEKIGLQNYLQSQV
jgi:bacterioferritin